MLPGEYISESSEHYYTSILPQKIKEELRRRHGRARRRYHTWEHVQELFRMLEQVDHNLDCLPAVVLAVVYHDAVYEPKRTDNEARSAALMRRQCKGMDLLWVERADRIITATAGHALPTGDAAGDTAYFLDMDLAILGAPPERYERYRADVRREYSHLTESQWRRGRSEFLTAMLDRFQQDKLFRTEWGRRNFGEQARENMSRELEELAQPPEPHT